MRIIAMIPFFRESRALTRECLENVAAYADAAVVCVNDRYDRETEDFLHTFPIVKRVAFVNKDTFSDAIFNSSLLTMAQSLNPDWVVKQDVDEEFEARFAGIREFLAETALDWISVLWPSYVRDRSHHCFFHHQLPAGTSKSMIFRFDLSRLYVPAGNLTNFEMADARRGAVNIRLFHKNLLKSDQENYTKFVRSGRESVHDLCVSSLRRDNPQVLRAGENGGIVTFQKRDTDAAALLPFCFESPPSPEVQAICGWDEQTRVLLARLLFEFYPDQDPAGRLAREAPLERRANRVLKAAVAVAVRAGVNRRLYSLIQKMRAGIS